MKEVMHKYYLRATTLMSRPSFSDVMDEVKELYEDKSLEELYDVIHSTARFVGLPSTLVWHIARPTAVKHAVRMAERGCPRSKRNCDLAGGNCCCRRGGR